MYSTSLSFDYEKRLVKKLEEMIPPIEITPKRINALLVYSQELFLWNNAFNLIGDIRATKLSQTEREDIFIVRHICDALSGWNTLKEKVGKKKGLTICDVGSGAGIPGVVLSIFFEEQNWTLIERSKKRCGFLQNVAVLSGLKQLTILEASIEDVKSTFDIVVFRAFRQLDEFFTKLVRLLNKEGCLVAYKGRIEQIENEIAIWANSLGEFVFEIKPIDFKTKDVQRNILVVSKTKRI